jgi:uncharacterized protein (TIGR01777 family)
MRITLTGASGFIGQSLVRMLAEAGHELHVLARSRKGLPFSVQFSRWDVLAGQPPLESVRDADAVIHLAGEPVAQRWTTAAKRRIDETRRIGTANLIAALSKLDRRPEVLVSASAIGYYGSRGDETLTENAPPGRGFLPKVCLDWEATADSAAGYGMRVVKLRTGIVLAPGGGALKEMLPPFRLGVGGPIASGRQWMAWIHRDDLVSLYRFAVENHSVSGALNAVAPEPVRNADFSHALGRALHRPAIVPVPGFALKLLFGEMAEVILASQRVIPERTLAAGFRHVHTDLDETLRWAVA